MSDRPKPEQDRKAALLDAIHNIEPTSSSFQELYAALDKVAHHNFSDWQNDELVARKPTQDAIDRLKLQSMKSNR